MKTSKIIFWSTTTLIFLFEGLMPALTFNTEMARQGISHLGYPLYFGNALVAAKVLGSLALIIPQVPARIKEWAYAGFAFDFIFAGISLWAVDGLNATLALPAVCILVLALSYTNYHKLTKA